MTDSSSNTQAWDLAPLELLEAVNALYQVSTGDGSETDPLSDIPNLDPYLKTLDDLCDRAGQLEYAGLQSACICLAEHIRNLPRGVQHLGEPLRSTLDSWPELLLNYLASPGDAGIARLLVEQLQLPVWNIPLAAEDAEMIEILLAGEHEPASISEAGNRLDLGDEAITTEMETVVSRESRHDDKDLAVPLPAHIHDLTAMLIDELPLLEEPLLKLIEIEPESDPQAWEAAFEVYDDYLERFGEATESIGFTGLYRSVALMRENLSLLAVRCHTLRPVEKELLTSWRGKACNYLNNPCDNSSGRALLEWLQDPAWPMPLVVGETTALLYLLEAPEFPVIGEEEGETRPQQAAAEDVMVRLPEDVNMELLDAMLQELPGQTETFSRAIQNLIQGGSMQDVNVAQRMAHTLKGAANTVGVSGIPTLTHHLEDILVALAKQQVLPPPSLAQSLMNAADCLEAMGEALCGISEAPDNAQAVLQEILDWANRIDREGLPTESVESQGRESRTSLSTREVPKESSGEHKNSPTMPALKTELVDNLLRMGGETIILSGQVKEQARQIGQRIRAMQSEFERLHQLGGELERLIDIRDLSNNRQRQTSSVFDSLEMDQYSELHTTSRMLVEAATDAHQIGGMVAVQLDRLDKMLLAQERLNHELQETVLNARMVPIKTVVPRLQRSVRQTCRLTDKQVELHISGADTLMDNQVLTELVDPLMHVLRNAVDHGIEDAVERKATGKSESGNIWLDFQRDGNNILVRCRDDGAGLDFTAIRTTAERRGLLQPGMRVTDDELKHMLLIPNFSTRSEVTQTSGRGVGLDVVYTHIISQGGSLSLNSTAGEGCTTEMRLPLSLISTHALLVRLQGQVVAVADRGIEQILHATDGTRRELVERDVFWVDDQVYPFRPLDEILQQAPDRRTATRNSMPVLLVNTLSGVNAVPVQEILRATDLVVKEFGRYVPRMPGILGATILGDGAVTPVLDLPELMHAVHRPLEPISDRPIESERAVGSLPLALVADDSLSARKAMVQVMQDAGYEVREARDGMEAVQLVEAERPDIVLVDMEMPRMNGIELTAHLRTRRLTADLPVIMVTSRSTTKHRQQAEAAGVDVYLTKPFQDDELLDQVARLRSRNES